MTPPLFLSGGPAVTTTEDTGAPVASGTPVYRAQLIDSDTPCVTFDDPWQPDSWVGLFIPVRFIQSPADVAYWCRVLARENWATKPTIVSFAEVAARLLTSS
jgi:hypothetical protein